MDTKGVIIQASARSKGNTNKITSLIQKQTGYELIDLKTKNIKDFDYDFVNKNDDFIPLIKEIVDSYEVIIFATPVYWYAMSGLLKTFLDRITDCLLIEKDTGRKFNGKYMGMVSCGSDQELKEGFTMPFRETANYLGMTYIGDIHTWLEGTEIPEKVLSSVTNFTKKLLFNKIMNISINNLVASSQGIE